MHRKWQKDLQEMRRGYPTGEAHLEVLREDIVELQDKVGIDPETVDQTTELNNIETSLGLTSTGLKPDFTSVNYILPSDTPLSAINKLDNQLYTEARQTALIKSLKPTLLEAKCCPVISIIGDSTSNDDNEWAYLLAQKIATHYPAYNVKYKKHLASPDNFGAWTDIQHIGDDRHIYRVYSSGSNHNPGIAYADITKSSPDFDLSIKLSLDDWQQAATDGSTRYIMAQSSSGTSKAWMLYLATNNILNFYWSTDGTAGTLIAQSLGIDTSAFVDGDIKWIRVTVDVDNGAGGYTLKGYTSTDGVTWTETRSVTGGTTTTIYDNSANYYIGGNGDVSSVNGVKGKFYEVIMRDGIDGISITPQPIESWHQITSASLDATIGGTPTLYIWNASIGGSGTNSWKDAAWINKFVPKCQGALVLINLGHNDTLYRNNTYATILDALATTLDARASYANKVLITQNPVMSPYPNNKINDRALRRNILIGWARKNNMSVIDTYDYFNRDSRGLAALVNNSDGLHPTTTGSELLRDVIYAHLFM